ncbi:MAG: threonine--tRNA ligase [Bdellovibrionales bacterium GWA2_49_15]|nr:MAG: threonine--tRNA ligase [Bdellovibrionales bacterium GWA2_49_15]
MNEFDHRVLGEKYNLFSFFKEGPGLPFWLERGLRIKNALIDYWRVVHKENDYEEIQSPILLDKELWKKSGHCDYFEENMYFSSIEKRDFAIKPMSCPGAILVFNQKKRSYAELPLRIAELGHVHRNENSGSLHGLMRARSFMQDDAHIFCRREQLLSEVKKIMQLIFKIMHHCELSDYHFELSLRGVAKKEYLGKDDEWSLAENVLEQALVDLKLPVKKNLGEAKFYGPSLDLHIKDIHGRFWQCSTIQLDFNLPARFEICYFDENGQRQVPFMLHRAIYGSLERFIGILLENFGKELPFWMHPVQYKIVSVSERINDYAVEVGNSLKMKGLHVDLDLSDRPLKEKIKRFHEDFIHSLIILGEDEKARRLISVKRRGRGPQEAVSLENLVRES